MQDVEHNYMHHYMLGEGRDPDLVERNTHHIREGNFPLALKFVDVAIIACMWKWYYYAPNTLKEMEGYEAGATRKHIHASTHTIANISARTTLVSRTRTRTRARARTHTHMRRHMYPSNTHTNKDTAHIVHTRTRTRTRALPHAHRFDTQATWRGEYVTEERQR